MWGFLWIVILSIIEIFGDFNLRFYAQSGALKNLGFGIVGYAGVVFALIKSLQLNNVLFVNAVWDGVSGLIGSAAAYYMLGDRLQKNQQYVGILFILAGLFLMKQD
jgi:multidrug transporter EmrE-like cation transporter